MVCVYCASSTSVVNSRLQKRVNQVWRRRKCQKCGAVFSSHEQADLEKSLAVRTRSSGEYKPFLRDKLFLSIHRSCAHRKTALADARALTNTIISNLLVSGRNGSISDQDIITTTSTALKYFDQAAAVHYQAFHPLLK